MIVPVKVKQSPSNPSEEQLLQIEDPMPIDHVEWENENRSEGSFIRSTIQLRFCLVVFSLPLPWICADWMI